MCDELRRAGFEPEIIDWFESFMADRHSNVVIDGFATEQRRADIGLPQGSGASPPALNVLMQRLVRSMQVEWGTIIVYADDGSLAIAADSIAQLTDRAHIMLGWASAWANATESRFEPDKAQLMLLRRHRSEKRRELPPIRIDGIAIARVASIRTLGVILDEHLNFKEHVSTRVDKARAVLGAIGRLTRSSRGAGWRSMHKLVTSTVLPVADFGNEAWFVPGLRGTGQLVNALRPINKEAARLVTGAWRCTGREALEVEADIEPVELRLERRSFRFAAHVRSAPRSHPLRIDSDTAVALLRQVGENVKRPAHAGLLFDSLRAFPTLQAEVETILPTPTAPWLEGLGTKVIVADSRKEGVEMAERITAEADEGTLVYFTDGSQLSRQQSSSSCVRIELDGEGRRTHVAFRQSADEWRIVYELELNAINIALADLSCRVRSGPVHAARSSWRIARARLLPRPSRDRRRASNSRLSAGACSTRSGKSIQTTR